MKRKKTPHPKRSKSPKKNDTEEPDQDVTKTASDADVEEQATNKTE